MDFGIASVAAITVIAYLVGIGCKAAGSVKDELIPVICGCVGAVDFAAGVEFGGGVGHSTRQLVKWAGLAQLAEQLICNQQVIGSNPIAGSNHKSPKIAVFSIETNVFGPFLCLGHLRP